MFTALVWLVSAASAGYADELVLGQVKAGKVIGDVHAIGPTGERRPLHNGDLLGEGWTVETPPDGSVVLVFSNGSSVRITAASRVELTVFRQDPLAEECAFTAIPSAELRSQVEMKLIAGEVVGSVRKLNRASSYQVRTPVGAAGIRGTIFLVQARPWLEKGDLGYVFATFEGLVRVTDLAGVKGVDLPGEREISGAAPAGLAPDFSSMAPARMSRSARAYLRHNADVMAEAARVVGFAPAEFLPLGESRDLRPDAAGKRESEDDLLKFSTSPPEWSSDASRVKSGASARGRSGYRMPSPPKSRRP